MKPEDLSTYAKITWCPGCGNFGILMAVKKAIADLVNEGFAKKEQFVLVSGIGCHAKIYDYIDINGFYSLHGRTLPPALGIKIANKDLILLVFAGDGDLLNEGISHFIHCARYNIDLTLILHNNQVFALTTGQATATTEKGFKGKSTPLGTFEEPLNPVLLALSAGATFVAREFAMSWQNLAETLKSAIKHKGFSFIDVLQPCVSFHNTTQFFKKHTYRPEIKNLNDKDSALKLAKEWQYEIKEDAKIPLGVFYKEEKISYEECWPALKEGAFYKRERKIDWKEVLKEKLI